MNIKSQIDTDLKQAMLAGDKTLTTTLRGLKSAIQYEEVAKDARESGLDENTLINLLSKEAKKRQESADMYVQGNNQEKADAELAEKLVIEKYLPAKMSAAELSELVDSVIKETGASGIQAMGQVIARAREQSQGKADGSAIAQVVKEKLSQ